MASEIKKPTKNNMCWDCLNEYRCDWLENIDGKCQHFTPDTVSDTEDIHNEACRD